MNKQICEFPFEKLPQLGDFPLPIYQNAVNQVIKAHKVPPKLPHYSAIAAACALAQMHFDVEKPAGGKVPGGVYVLMRGKKGIRKTKVDECFFSAFRKPGKEQRKRSLAEVERYEIETEIWSRKEKILMKKLDKSWAAGLDTSAIESTICEHRSSKPAEHKEIQLVFSDVTIAALKDKLFQSPNATLLASEGKKILRDLLLQHDAEMNQLWSGEEIAVNRVTASSYVLENARLTFSIMIQDESLTRLMDGKGKEAQESGFFSRVIFSDVGSTIGERLIDILDTSDPDLDAYEHRVAKLLNEYLEALKKGNYCRRILRFSNEAARAWIAYFNYAESNTNEGGRYEKVYDHGIKLPDNVARVAGGLHVLEGFDGEIGMDCLLCAIVLCNEASKDYVEHFVPKDIDQIEAQELKNWLVEKCVRKNKEFVEINWIIQHGPYRMRKAPLIHRYLEILEGQGYLKLEAPSYARAKALVKLDMNGSGHIRSQAIPFWKRSISE